jgi:uncharacterized protein YyaL (SSP411 family)
MPNRLIDETSPYLKQHAHNPVDWHPWGDEAFARARAEDRPILLSVGYAACHWCHVMERESFEDEATARVMNEWFVPVKVDREERPDVDAIYMQAVQAMTGHGGWPMTVFLTPDGEPFFGGTYFPPDDRHGMPSFRRVLLSVADAWRSRRDAVAQTVGSLRRMYAQVSQTAAPTASGALTRDTLVRAQAAIAARYDREHGGTRGAPKFPQAMTSDFLLRRWARTGDATPLAMVAHTFRAMARGGMYDQVGGGFHRYAVDAEWLVPHFEKMLYDNALLARLGVHLWQATGDGEARRVTEETLAWVAREMTSPAGGFYATLDADSEGHEGKFYVWTADELRDALADLPDDARTRVAAYWGVTATGNFEGANVLHVRLSEHPAAEEGDPSLRSGEAALADAVRRAKARLLEVRERRVRPARDEKILAAWNGLMLRAVAEAARAFGDPALRALALRNGEFLAATLVDGETGRVRRVHMDGVTRIGGFLEDHAAVALGFLALHALTLDERWLELAVQITGDVVARFWDDVVGAFFDTPADGGEGPPLITRPRDPTDNATPSGTSLALELCLIVADLTGDERLRARADRVLGALADSMAQFAPAFGHVLGAADLAVEGPAELVLVGDPAADDLLALAAAAGRVYVPGLIVTGGPAGDDVGGGPAGRPRGSPLRAGRGMVGGRATAYVCRHSTCDLPTNDPRTLAEQLAAVGVQGERA